MDRESVVEGRSVDLTTVLCTRVREKVMKARMLGETSHQFTKAVEKDKTGRLAFKKKREICKGNETGNSQLLDEATNVHVDEATVVRKGLVTS